jgi:hypothetical protein
MNVQTEMIHGVWRVLLGGQDRDLQQQPRQWHLEQPEELSPLPSLSKEGQPTGQNDNSSKARGKEEDDANNDKPEDEESEHTMALHVEA